MQKKELMRVMKHQNKVSNNKKQKYITLLRTSGLYKQLINTNHYNFFTQNTKKQKEREYPRKRY